MERLNLEYMNPKIARGYDFYLIPKLLLSHKAFSKIDYGAKILYGLMLNRASLSAINLESYTDDSGRLYIIYTVEQVMNDMWCSNKTAVRMIKQLDDIGLIEKRRQGQGKPSIIYIKDFNTVEQQKCRIYTSRNVESTLQEVENVHSSKNDNSKNDINPLSQVDNQSINQSYIPIDNNKITIDRIDKIDYLQCMEKTKENIEYDILCSDKAIDRGRITEMVEIIADTLCSTKEYIRVNGEDKPADIVKRRLAKLDAQHIQYVYGCMEYNTTKIHNIRAYLLSALYNAPASMGSYYRANANYTLYGYDEE